MSLYTLSRLKLLIEAMLPVLKNALWMRVRKKREMRKSEIVRGREVCVDRMAGRLSEVVMLPLVVELEAPFWWVMVGGGERVYKACSNLTHVSSMMQKVK